jgi:hypothetical protein
MASKIKTRKRYLNPFNKSELRYWARNWNITFNQMKDLLGVTGSSRIDKLQDHLRQVGLMN